MKPSDVALGNAISVSCAASKYLMFFCCIGVQDVGNAMLAGGVVGALSELPIMLHAYLLRDVEKQFVAKVTHGL